MNPLLADSFGTPFETLPFADITLEHFLPAFEARQKEAKERIEKIVLSPEAPTFENTIVALEAATEWVSLVSEVFFSLLGSIGDDAWQKLAPQLSLQFSELQNDIVFNERLAQRVRAVKEDGEVDGLSREEKRFLEKTYRLFLRNGAFLSGETKEKLREIDQELAKLNPKFSENALAERNAWEMIITDSAMLEGVPENVMKRLADDAAAHGHAGAWRVTLDPSLSLTLFKTCRHRPLRQAIAEARARLAFGGEHDNCSVAKRIAVLRHERAQILGYLHHAAYILEERMAGDLERVQALLGRLKEAALPVAQNELEETRQEFLKDFPREEMMSWDYAFYAEQIREKRFSFNEEEIRVYFSFEKVRDGFFGLVNRLYGITFVPEASVSVYHEVIETYRVLDEKGDFLGLLYVDAFSRLTKRSGAWMAALREQGLFAGEVRRPHVSVTCNFTPPTAQTPSLLTLDEVRTFFHEMGHALHGLFSQCRYRFVAGTNVAWDFVELPSQIMENWATEPEVLATFAHHYQSNEPLPASLLEAIRDSAAFHEGYFTVRQLSFAVLDMAWHAHDPSSVDDLERFEAEAIGDLRLLPHISGSAISSSLSHIFDGGYSAGYYGYKWAEVLDADAFALFEEKGIFDVATADRFRRLILEKGDSVPALECFVAFRGREPDPEALLRRGRLLHSASAATVHTPYVRS